MPRPPKNPIGRTFVTRCKFEWVSGSYDKIHDCGQHDKHADHVCADDGCEERVPVATKGGRYRGNQARDDA